MKKESKKETCCDPMEMTKVKPSMRMDETDFPEMKGMKMGEECEVKCKIKMKSMNMGSEYGESEEKKIEGRFEIMDMEPIAGRKGKVESPNKEKLEVVKEKAKQY